jgi:hypothetical protein
VFLTTGVVAGLVAGLLIFVVSDAGYEKLTAVAPATPKPSTASSGRDQQGPAPATRHDHKPS